MNLDRTTALLVGGYTDEMDQEATGLTSLRLTRGADGPRLESVDGVVLDSPTYLVAGAGTPWVFAVGESPVARVHSLRREPDGRLALLGTQLTGGAGACHLALGPDGDRLVVTEYDSGAVVLFGVTDGVLSPPLDRLVLVGSGPDTERQQGSHAHQAVWDGDELLVVDLGADRVHRLRVADDRLVPAAEPVVLPPGSGPRHLVLVDEHLVVAEELTGRLWLGRRTAGGDWTEMDRVPSSGRRGDGVCFPSALRHDGRRVWVANRGPDTVAEFALDVDAGTLTLVAEGPSGGAWPRDLVVTSDALWVANQRGHTLAVIDRDDLAAGPRLVLESPSPACVVLLDGPDGAIA